MKGKKQDSIENELMNLMTRRERTETVEEMDQEQIKSSEGMVKRTVQDTVFLYIDCGADKQEMMKNEMMNLMRKRGGQKIQEGRGSQDKQRQAERCCPIHYDPMRNGSSVETSWAAGNVSLYGMGPDFAELLALCSQCVVLVFPELLVL